LRSLATLKIASGDGGAASVLPFFLPFFRGENLPVWVGLGSRFSPSSYFLFLFLSVLSFAFAIPLAL
jgi:hypothetical protein